MNMPIVYLYNLETEKGGKIKTLCLLLKMCIRDRDEMPQVQLFAYPHSGGNGKVGAYRIDDVYFIFRGVFTYLSLIHICLLQT